MFSIRAISTASVLLFLVAGAAGCKESAPPTNSILQPTADEAGRDNLSASFSRAVSGFPKCDLPDLFVDAVTGEPAHVLFTENNLKPCKVTDQLAFYCVREKFHGLPVAKLAIPTTTLPVFALYFDVDVNTARTTLKRELGSEFRPSASSRAGVTPELISDPEELGKSVLICTKDF